MPNAHYNTCIVTHINYGCYLLGKKKYKKTKNPKSIVAIIKIVVNISYYC